MTTLESCAERFLKIFPAGEGGSQPTESSLRTIQDRLGFSIPGDFAEFARMCPAYHGWFVSIGEDFEDGRHILKLNALHHSPEYCVLPPELIMINHGYDGDFDCYDLSKRDETSRISICYLEANESEYPLVRASRKHVAFSLVEYLEPQLVFWERIERKAK
jgi:hypothetical protein